MINKRSIHTLRFSLFLFFFFELLFYRLYNRRTEPMLIIGTVSYTSNVVRCFDIRRKTLAAIQAERSNTVYYAVIVNNSDDVVFLNLTTMLQEMESVRTAVNWLAFLALLTDNLISFYRDDTVVVPAQQLCLLDNGTEKLSTTPFQGAAQINPIIKSLEHNDEFIVDYGTIENPSLRNQKHLIFMLNDLIISHHNLLHPTVNFNNVLPIVNGSVHYPQLFNGELFVRGGSEVCYSTDGTNQPVILIDFTPVGNMELIRLSDCSFDDSVFDNASFITLPTNKTVNNKTAFFVIANRLFLPHELEWVNPTTFILSPKSLNVGRLLLHQKALKDAYLTNTGTITTTDATFDASLHAPTDYSNFVVLIDTPNLKCIPAVTSLPVTHNSVLFPGRCGGLLRKHDTKAIVDYTRIEYETDTLVSFTDPLPQRIVKHSNPNNLIADISIMKSLEVPFEEELRADKPIYTLYDIVR